VNEASRYPKLFPPRFASAWGDDRFGLWAEFTVEPDGGEPVVQRMRWIEPGTFTMGSPDDEPEREELEGPAHSVTISRGFWLADTACTQALWQAVTGRNPSHFTGSDQRPVEQVNWHDVQKFLKQLESLLPGCKADLPAEAEWEYACRAGTDTSFSFGKNVTPQQVNYDGERPYAGQKNGLSRQQTVPARSLPPNPWGLYEMHGNVLEWCADGMREYDGSPQIDPTGLVTQAERAHRAVRGGSWIDYAWRARSAYRHTSPPDLALYIVGFRLCLRSIEPGPV